MAIERRSKAASSWSSDHIPLAREALLAFVACLAVSLALLHTRSTSRDESSTQARVSPTGLPAEPGEEKAVASTRRTGSSLEGSSLERMRPAVEAPDVELAIQPLRIALTDSDPKVRLQAVTSLGDGDGEQAGMMLTAVVLKDPDATVRQEAIAALSERRGRADMRAIEQALLDADNTVQEVAIEAFVAIGGDASALALTTLTYHQDPALRQQVVDALAEIGGPVAVDSLRLALKDEVPAIRAAAAEALADLSQ